MMHRRFEYQRKIFEQVKKCLQDELVLVSSEQPRPKVRSHPEGHDYYTPAWKIFDRPVRPQDLGNEGLFPSLFMRPAFGKRSASGSGLENKVRAGVNHIAVEYAISIQSKFRDGYGEAITRGGDKAKSLSDQINNFIADLDKCLNAYTIRPSDLNPGVDIQDAYISEWVSQEEFDGSGDQVVSAVLTVTLRQSRSPRPVR